MFVRDFLGQPTLATIDRYLSAKLRLEELKRLDDAFTPVGVTVATSERDPEPETIPAS